MTKFASRCEPVDGDHEPPAACQATFTIDGQSGNQKYLTAGIVTLQADDTSADSFHWQVTSSPPHCDYILTGSTQATAKLTMPGSGAYVVQLSVCKGECVAQSRVILWVATPRRLYRIPADSEALRFDGDEEWVGDLARVVQAVDWSMPTPDQKAALDGAHGPGEENPFATLNDLSDEGGSPCELTEDEVAAIKEANEPGVENPFATLEDLPGGSTQPCDLTDAELAAIRAAEEPGGENPFVTDSHQRRFAPTADQKAALDKGDEPSADNPFVTAAHLGRVAPTAEQKKALDAADEPSQHNPYVTQSHLHGHVPTLEQREALDRAEDPRGENPFVTESRLERDILTADQRAAIRRARAPTWENPFVTDSHLRESSPTTEQRAALNNARCPDGENPFVTESHLEELAPIPEQRAALDSAQDPDAANPFITQSALPTIPEPQLTPDQEAAVDAAEKPNAKNPFITQSALPAPQLSPDQEAAVDAGENPSATNPFITRSALPEIPGLPFTGDQVKAIQKANDPTEDNPFVTRVELPVGVSPNQKEALDHANQPSATNPVATFADLGQAGVVTRIVAAGALDLSVMHSTPRNGLGRLEVVGILPERGVATLHFQGYQLARKDNYVVKALPIRADAKVVSTPPSDPLGFRQFIVVQLVEFNARGFELQMIQPLHQVSGVPALGPCMIEVSEIVTKTPEPPPVTLEQAIKRYYKQVQQQDYAKAWPMLSQQFRTAEELTFERYVDGWERSGPAILVGLHRCEVEGSRATLVLDLDFPSEGPDHERRTHLISHDLICDEDEGHPRFGRWLFVAGREVELEDELSEIWDRLTEDERDRLGQVRDPCTPEITAKFTLQRFERGLMYWFEHPASTEDIWVLYEPEADYMRGASWRRYVDDWPKEDEYSCDEARANGPKGPVRGFGWLWCNNAEVREGVGDPVDQEAGSGDEPPYSRGVFFEGGAIFFKPGLQDPVNTTNQGIVLINGGGWRRLDLS
jgi:hypothetical protein